MLTNARDSAHTKQYTKVPNDQDGYVCWTALMLCRLAKTQGIAVADDGYLPARLVSADPIR